MALHSKNRQAVRYGIVRVRRMTHRIVRFEIGCDHAGNTRDFYAKLFDWKIEPLGPNFSIDTGAAPAGGIVSLGHEPRHYTMFYVEVPNIDAALAKAEELGGKKVVGPVKLPNGAFAWFTDPEQNMVGLWQPA
jgi:uncharacterized protein